MLLKGLDSGGIDDETYTAYDKPWRPQDSVQQHIYRPRKHELMSIFNYLIYRQGY